MDVNFEKLPAELNKWRWVCWRVVEKSGKPTKVPLQANNGKNASVTNSRHWSHISDAQKSYENHKGKFDGVGFVFVQKDGLVGIDLDKCRNPETGTIEPWANEIVMMIDSYSEITPSGTGVHIIAKGTLPKGGRKRGHLETYCDGRFFTVTGAHLEGTPPDVMERGEEIRAFHEKYFAPASDDKKSKAASTPNGVADADLIEKARAAKNGQTFSLLWAGDWRGAGYSSHSEGDLSLCSMLGFWTGRDPARMDSLFRRSGLMREKWDEKHGAKTYGELTIEKALAGGGETYRPGAASSEDTRTDPGQEMRLKPGQDLTDMGNSLRLAVATRGDYRYCVEFGKWLHWTGNRWQIDNDGEIYRLARGVVRQLHAKAAVMQDPKDGVRYAKWAITSQNEARINAMVSLCESEPGIPIHADDLDRDPWLLNVANGVIELRTGAFREHRRMDFITKLAPVEYQPGAACPFWMEHLKRVFAGDEGLISFLQLAFGYSLTGATDERCLFISHGPGANGKTATHETFAAILGDYAARTPTETLLARRTGSIPNDLARLKGTRFVYCSEAEEGKRLAESMVKDITGGDKVSARFLHREWFDYFPNFKIFLATNHKPEIRGTDDAIWARVRLIPFNAVIPEGERIPRPRFLEKLTPEYPGILAWGVAGCKEWLQCGLFTPDLVKGATLSYREEMDLVGNFLNECAFIDKRAEAAAAELYARFKKWCEDGGEKDFSQKRFGTRLKERGFTQGKLPNNRTSWKGIGLLTADRKD